MKSINHIKEEDITSDEPQKYEGSWERRGRSLNAAAVLGLLGVGVLYFNMQTILVFLAVATQGLTGSTESIPEGNFFEYMVAFVKIHAEPIRIAVVLSQYFFMLLPAWWLVKRWHTLDVRGYVRLKGSSLLEVLLAVIATVAIIPTGTYIANELARQFDIPDILVEIGTAIFTAHSPIEFLWLVFVVAITPAICEEFFFRGFVQRTFERTIQWKSVLLIGFIFGLFHMQPLGLITLSLLGIVFGYFYYRSQSLLPSMAAHFTNNFIAIYLLYRTPEVEGIDLASMEQIPFLWIAVTLPIGLGVLFWYHKLTSKDS